MLRACVGCTSDDDELSRLIQTLFLEQRSGLKKSLKVDSRSPPHALLKAYLCRQRMFVHLRSISPQFADVVDDYELVKFYATEYGLDEYGNFLNGQPVDTVDEENVDEERRLAYVGITRAQQELTLTYAKTAKRIRRG